MKVYAIARTAITRLLRDKSNVFFVFIFPLLLVLLLGLMFGGGFSQRLGILDESDGTYSQELIALLSDGTGLRIIEDYDESEALITAVERGQLEAALVIPADFDDELGSGGSVTLEYVARPDQNAQGVRNTLDTAVTRAGQVFRTAGFISDTGAAEFDVALEAAAEAVGQSSRIELAQETVGEEFVFDRLGAFDLGAYSQLLLFVFLTSATGSTALIQARQLGVAKRMLSTPTPVGTILLGEGLGRLAVALIQGVFIMVGTALIFDVNWGDPLGAAAVLLAFSLVGAGAAMLMGATFKNDQQAGGVGVMIGLALAALGGCMFPLALLEILSPTLYQIAHISPHAWGIEAFEKLIHNDLGFVDVLPEIGILTAYATVLFAVAMWRFRATLTRA